MKVEAFVLCDAATKGSGKLNILGAFDCIYAEQVPVKHFNCEIVARIRVNEKDIGNHQIKINITDKDGKKVKPSIDGSLNVILRRGRETDIFNIVLSIHRMTLERHGQYNLDLVIDKEVMAISSFYVTKTVQE